MLARSANSIFIGQTRVTDMLPSYLYTAFVDTTRHQSNYLVPGPIDLGVTMLLARLPSNLPRQRDPAARKGQDAPLLLGASRQSIPPSGRSRLREVRA